MEKLHRNFFIDNRFSEDFIKETMQVFDSASGGSMSDEECVVLAQNIISLELYLRELKEKYEKASISFD